MIKTKMEWNGKEVKIRGKKYMGNSTFELGLIVEGQGKLLADKDTGRMAASITTQAREKGTSPSGKGAVSSDVIQKPNKEFEVFVGTPVLYANYRELGTKYADAHPFLRPALDLAKGKALTLLQKNGKIYFGEYLQ